VDFVWDENKRAVNLRKHGIDFADCAQMFQGPLVTWPDMRFDYGRDQMHSGGTERGILLLAIGELSGKTRDMYPESCRGCRLHRGAGCHSCHLNA
jgi:hypothetical protein